MSRENQFGIYRNRKVEILRPSTPGDAGWDPHKDGQVLIRYADEPLEGKEVSPEIVVDSGEISSTKE